MLIGYKDGKASRDFLVISLVLRRLIGGARFALRPMRTSVIGRNLPSRGVERPIGSEFYFRVPAVCFDV